MVAYFVFGDDQTRSVTDHYQTAVCLPTVGHAEDTIYCWLVPISFQLASDYSGAVLYM